MQNRRLYRKRAASLPHKKDLSWLGFLRDFFENTSFSSLRHIVEQDRHCFERFIWILVAVLCSVATSIAITHLWTKFQIQPTVISIEKNRVTWRIPKNAIFFCPTGVPASNIEQVKQKYWTEEESTTNIYVEDFLHMLANVSYHNLELLGKYENYISLEGRNLQEIYLQLQPECTKYILQCSASIPRKICCEEYLNTVLTDSGLCFSLNSEIATYTNLPKYRESISSKPAREISTLHLRDKSIGIALCLRSQKNKAENIIGKGYFLSPYELPDVTDTIFQIAPPRSGKKVLMSTTTIVSAPDVRKLRPTQRECLFADEKNLTVSARYSQSACHMQCRLNAIIRHCKCAPYFLPIPDGVKQCDFGGIQCMAHYARQIMETGISHLTQETCHCPPLCSETVFTLQEVASLPGFCMSAISELPTVRYNRQVIFTWIDILVYFGGIVNLFLGFSLLSAVELAYYLTFQLARLFMARYNVQKRRKRKIAPTYGGRKEILPPVEFNYMP